MEAREFITKVRRLSHLQGVTIRFAKDGKAGLRPFYNLLSLNRSVKLSSEFDKVVMLAVISSGEWESDRNRLYTVFGLSMVEDRWLTEIAGYIETVEVGEHGARDLMTSRQKRRDEAAQKIIGQILTADLVDEMNDWGMTIDGNLSEVEGLPLVMFKGRYGDDTIVAVSIDGWSGRISVGGMFFDEIYVRPKQVQKLLRERTEAMLEKLTA